MAQTREFHLGDVLTLITNHNVSLNKQGSWELISFLTGNKEWLKSRRSATANSCRQYLIKKFPQFDSPEMKRAMEDLLRQIQQADTLTQRWTVTCSWVVKQAAKYGEYITVESMV